MSLFLQTVFFSETFWSTINQSLFAIDDNNLNIEKINGQIDQTCAKAA